MLTSFIKQAWLVIVLSLVFGVALAAVQQSLQPRIDENKRARMERAVLEVVPGGTASSAETVGGQSVYRVTDAEGKLVGWGVLAETTGFQDKIRMMIGVSADASTITGLAILESNETPGLGDKIYGEFRHQFKGKPANGSLEVVKAGQTATHPIHAITGATISSKAVTRGVNEQLTKVRDALIAAGGSSQTEVRS